MTETESIIKEISELAIYIRDNEGYCKSSQATDNFKRAYRAKVNRLARLKEKFKSLQPRLF